MVRDGYIYGLSLLAVAVALVGLQAVGRGRCAGAAGGLLFCGFSAIPRRTIPAGDGLIVSPGDGLVTETTPSILPKVAAADQHLPQRI
jgi:phosphatidylserine decarboxylase